MLTELTDIQQATRDTFRDLVNRHVIPQAARIDQEKIFPVDLFREVGKTGFFGMRYPAESGGSGMDAVSYMLAVMELARGSLSLAASCTMQSLMGTYFLYRFGNAYIHKKYFLPALQGDLVGGICMTEPEAGSDLMAIQTKALVTPDGYILNGQKTWVTSAPVADFFTVFARTENEKEIHPSLSIFFVPANLPGVQVGKTIDKMGVRGSLTSEVGFSDVYIKPEYILGGIGIGTNCLKEILSEIRVMTAALSVGVATAAYEEALQYARTRSQFGKTISRFQAIQIKLADMAMQLDTARIYVLHAAQLLEKDKSRMKEAMIAKLYASEAAASVCDQACRVLASYGYSTEYNVERYLRDVRFTLIGGGTSEILKINIAKELGL